MPEIGLLCGTFNPIHWGHLLLAECARDQFHLQKVLFITSAFPPHRTQDLLAAEQRHQMVEAATAGNSSFQACRMELERPGPSYTVDTLRQLKSQLSEGTRLNLIVGTDNIPYIQQWKEAQEIFRLCRILSAPRRITGQVDKDNAKDGPALPTDIATIDFPQIDISSTSIRQRLQSGLTVLYMVPPAVNNILVSHNFYSRQTETSK